MSKSEILAELPNLNAKELAEILSRIDELVGDVWLDDGELSDSERASLDAELREYAKNPDAGSSWKDVEARILHKLQ